MLLRCVDSTLLAHGKLARTLLGTDDCRGALKLARGLVRALWYSGAPSLIVPPHTQAAGRDRKRHTFKSKLETLSYYRE